MIKISDKSTDITCDILIKKGKNHHKHMREITTHHKKNSRELNNVSPNLCRQTSLKAYEDFTFETEIQKL